MEFPQRRIKQYFAANAQFSDTVIPEQRRDLHLLANCRFLALLGMMIQERGVVSSEQLKEDLPAHPLRRLERRLAFRRRLHNLPERCILTNARQQRI